MIVGDEQVDYVDIIRTIKRVKKRKTLIIQPFLVVNPILRRLN